MLTLKKTCDACPEQYDALDENGKTIGYIRLRWNRFRVYHPDVGGDLIFEEYIEDFGNFDTEESRNRYLSFAVDAIQKALKGKFPYKKTTKEKKTPKVKYKVVDTLIGDNDEYQ
jgi:hypothetical protein